EVLRREVTSFGHAAAVVGTPQLVRVHLHTDDPGAALSWAVRLGRLSDVTIEDMQAQHERLSLRSSAYETDRPVSRAGPALAAEATAEEMDTPPDGSGLTVYRAQRALPVDGVHVQAVVSGEGFARICAELGADAWSI